MKELKNFSTVRKCTKGVKVKHENLLPEHQLTRLAERELGEYGTVWYIVVPRARLRRGHADHDGREPGGLC